MNPRAKKVHVKEGFTLEVEFSNGEIRLFDVTPFLQYPVYKPLKDRALFEQIFIRQGIVQWPNEIDIAPDTLYLDSKTLPEVRVRARN